MKVLVIDDDVDIAESTVMLLEMEGHEAQCQTDAQHIMASATAFQPDAILHDINMPGLDIHASIPALRNALPARIFVFTASPTGQEVQASTGADGLISKPFDVAELLAVIG